MPSKKKPAAKKQPPKKQGEQLRKKNLTLLGVLLGLVAVLFIVGMLRVTAGS